MSDDLRILAVVQLRPVESGQAVMNRLVTGLQLPGATWRVLDASLCDRMSEMRGISLRKLWRLALLPARVLAARWRGPDILYYTPSGPTLQGCLKDALVLLPARLVFRATILHVHASGIGAYLQQRKGLIAWAAYRALRRCELLVRLSPATPPDHVQLDAKDSVCIPNALPDESALLAITRPAVPTRSLRLLFVGLHVRAKGLDLLLDAMEILRRDGREITLDTIGSFNDEAYRQEVLARVRNPLLAGAVKLSGARFGAEKLDAFARANLFVFPTTFDSETLPLVVMEAMAAGLPVISTRWRGIPDLVQDGVTGTLLAVEDPASLAARLARAINELAGDPELRMRMSAAGRAHFLAWCSQSAFQVAWTDAFSRLASHLKHQRD